MAIGLNPYKVAVFIFLPLGIISQTVDLDVTVNGVSGQTLSFDTGLGIGSTNTIEVHVFDKCRLESATRTLVGKFFPESTVAGIDASGSGIAPGPGNSISYTFVEGIASNTDIYQDVSSTTAKVEFCAQIGLYVGEYLSNWEEVKITYHIDLVTNLPSNPDWYVTSALDFLDTLGIETGLDGTLSAYFCDKDSKEELPLGFPTTQGSIITICFNIDEGQFEVEDIIDMVVQDLGASGQVQTIVENDQTTGNYGEKWCEATSPTTQHCLVSFLLKASFFDHSAMTLTGDGSLLMQLGDGTSGRKKDRILRQFTLSQMRSGRALETDEAVSKVQVKAHEFPILKDIDDIEKGRSGAPVSHLVIVWMFVIALLFIQV